MDPFSIAVGTTGVVDVCVRLVKYLKDFENAVAGIDEEVRSMVLSLQKVKIVITSIVETFQTQWDPSSANAKFESTDPLWQETLTMIVDCQSQMEKMETLLIEIKGKENSKGPSKFDAFKKQLRKQSKDDEYGHLRRDLDHFVRMLQIQLQVIGLSYNAKSQISNNQLSDNIHILRGEIKQLRSVMDSKSNEITPSYTNKYFDTPQSVSSIFTGRETELDELGRTFFAPPADGKSHTQRRFIIHGMGGSGKTQWCCKFAEIYRERFWGVFWISASSPKRASQTFSRIAKDYAGREPKEAAAKDWLSNLELPWLLIIDNAASDDSEFQLENVFPKGERGHILITTRDSTHRRHGTVGYKSFFFADLDHEQAISLLLEAADSHPPWGLPTREAALEIIKELGSLPLFLIYAGRAIMEGHCTLQNYVEHYNTTWQRLDQVKGDSEDRPDHHYMNVYFGFEVVYLALKNRKARATNDALELLNMFAFLSNGDIQFHTLEQAAKNPAAERELAKQDAARQQHLTEKRRTWTEKVKMAGMLS